MTCFLFRRSPSSPAEEHTHTYEEADNSIPAEMEPPAVESWKTLNHHGSGPSTKDGGLFLWCHTVLLAQQQSSTPSISYSISFVNVDVLDIVYYNDLKPEGPVARNVWSIIYHSKKENLYAW